MECCEVNGDPSVGGGGERSGVLPGVESRGGPGGWNGGAVLLGGPLPGYEALPGAEVLLRGDGCVCCVVRRPGLPGTGDALECNDRFWSCNGVPGAPGLGVPEEGGGGRNP